MVHYTLHYFDVRGAGETIRLILHYANMPFQDVRIPLADWPQKKAAMPFGKVPVLEVDGKPLAQLFAIARYLARQCGLAGRDAWEEAKVDELADYWKDVMIEIAPYIRTVVGVDPGEKDKLYKEVFVPVAEKDFAVIERRLAGSLSGYLMSSGLTWIDFPIAEFFTTVHNLHPEVMANYPNVEKHRRRVHSHPRVKSYVEGRKEIMV